MSARWMAAGVEMHRAFSYNNRNYIGFGIRTAKKPSCDTKWIKLFDRTNGDGFVLHGNFRGRKGIWRVIRCNRTTLRIECISTGECKNSIFDHIWQVQCNEIVDVDNQQQNLVRIVNRPMPLGPPRQVALPAPPAIAHLGVAVPPAIAPAAMAQPDLALPPAIAPARAIQPPLPANLVQFRIRRAQMVQQQRARVARQRQQQAIAHRRRVRALQPRHLIAICPFCREVHLSNDNTILIEETDANGDGVLKECPICSQVDEPAFHLRCCSALGAEPPTLCLPCAMRINFAAPPPPARHAVAVPPAIAAQP